MEKPAIEGGKPVRPEYLNFCLPQIDQNDIDAVTAVLKSGWLTTGKICHEFEAKFASYIGTKHALTVNSCTAGLHLALQALGVKSGDEVIVPSYTFSATANVVVHSNAKPVFADVGKDFNIDPSKIKSALTKKTKAIIPVHFGGLSCKMDEIMEIAEKNNLYVIEDCAHTIGTTFKGRKTGSFGHASAFSFYATKNLTTAEGGMVTTNDDVLADRMRVLRLHGISKDAWKRYGKGGSWYYDLTDAGFKYNLSDLQASLGLSQFAKIDQFNKRRKEIASKYVKALSSESGVINCPHYSDSGNCWHLYPLLLDLDKLKIDRAQFIKALEAENISTSVHFIPLHMQPFYRDTYGWKKGDLPVTEWLYEREVSLPLYPGMKDSEVQDVINAVKKVLAYYRK